MDQSAQAAVKVRLLKILEKLKDDDFDGFKWHLENSTKIPASKLDQAERRRTVDLLVQFFPQEAEDQMITFLKSIDREDLVQLLSQSNAGDSQR